jgi:uncharacterized membrane protein
MNRWSLVPLFIVLLVITAPAAGANGDDVAVPLNDTESYFNQLILDIYVDKTGKTLLTGYVENITSLPFLQTAEYIYENDTRQLYALTNALTWKHGDTWMLNFTTRGYYTDFHIVFYLPEEVSLGRINSPPSLEYLVSASNESLIVDIQGYDIESPTVTIEYQQPLTETEGADADTVLNGDDSGNGYSFGYLPLIIALFVISVALIIAVLKLKRREEDTTRHHVEEPPAKEGGIEKTPEMARVMETLTDREKAIVKALLKHNGEMTQADLRYETEIPKSSLTGILRTLERRKIIQKKEWGRTNVIELSEWFLSQNGG